MSELLNVSCKNFISKAMLLACFTKRKTLGELGKITVLGAWMSHLAQSLAAFPPPLEDFCQTAFLSFSECLFYRRYVRGPIGEVWVPVLQILTREQDIEYKLDNSKVRMTWISHGAKSRELQSTQLKSGEG